MDAVRRWNVVSAVLTALVLSACVSDAHFVDRDGWTNYSDLQEAESDCNPFWSTVLGATVTVLLGAAEVAAASASPAGEAPIPADTVYSDITAAAGGVSADDAFRRCMAEKGYIQTAAPAP